MRSWGWRGERRSCSQQRSKDQARASEESRSLGMVIRIRGGLPEGVEQAQADTHAHTHTHTHTPAQDFPFILYTHTHTQTPYIQSKTKLAFLSRLSSSWLPILVATATQLLQPERWGLSCPPPTPTSPVSHLVLPVLSSPSLSNLLSVSFAH